MFGIFADILECLVCPCAGSPNTFPPPNVAVGILLRRPFFVFAVIIDDVSPTIDDFGANCKILSG